jgi:hypothetical protein
LDRGIDGDRTQPDNRRALIEDVTADDMAVQLGDDYVIARVGEPSGKVRDRPLGSGRVRGKPMVLRNRLKRLIADGPTPVGIVGPAQAECEGHRVASSGGILAALP